ncbi:MAG: hypothetical protein ACE37K_24885 [Planctomycetota bacterium]
MRRYRNTLAKDSTEWKVITNTIAYFRRHQDRMRYAEFIARGLPIRSDPVESAAKTIVQARLKAQRHAVVSRWRAACPQPSKPAELRAMGADVEHAQEGRVTCLDPKSHPVMGQA